MFEIGIIFVVIQAIFCNKSQWNIITYDFHNFDGH